VSLVGWTTVSAFTVAIAAALAIWGRPAQRRWVHWLAKPSAMLSVLASLILLCHAANTTPPYWLVLGMTCALLGDVLLMFSEPYFVAGAGAFLMTLLCYAWSFLSLHASLAWLSVTVPLAFIPGLLVYRWLRKGVGRLRRPIFIYVCAMSLFVGSATAYALAAPTAPLGRGAAALGALLFMASDTLVARRRFVAPAAPYGVELGSYFAAQWLLALSAWVT